MFNIGGGEVLVILIVALVVLGPAKLPGAARQIGQMMTELRRISAGFQNELRNALDEAETPAPKAETPAPKAEPADPELSPPTDA